MPLTDELKSHLQKFTRIVWSCGSRADLPVEVVSNILTVMPDCRILLQPQHGLYLVQLVLSELLCHSETFADIVCHLKSGSKCGLLLCTCQNLLYVVCRHKTTLQPLSLQNLPADPPCLESLTLELVRPGDFRQGLRPNEDYTVITREHISKGTVVGLYRSMAVTKADDHKIKQDPPREFHKSKTSWGQCTDAYATDVCQPCKGSKAAKQHGNIFTDVLQVTCLHPFWQF